ncbi:MAG: hypothetical protein IRZ11_08685 [Clostridia bacterium]|nr:hypothetical protein [Clostridia bacterium]
MPHLLLLTDRGLEVEPAPEDAYEFDGGHVYVPAGIDARPILDRVRLWHLAFREMITFPRVRLAEILVAADPRAVGAGAGPDDTIGFPVMWKSQERWQRNIWHLTHEVCEYHLKDQCTPPRWFVEGFAQLCAFDLLGRLPEGDPLNEARAYYGGGSAQPGTFFSWDDAPASNMTDLATYLRNVHFTQDTRTLYASALWLFVNAHITPDAALRFALTAGDVPRAEWRERFGTEFDLPSDVSVLLRAPFADVK